jgi:hypothetical protein
MVTHTTLTSRNGANDIKFRSDCTATAPADDTSSKGAPGKVGLSIQSPEFVVAGLKSPSTSHGLSLVEKTNGSFLAWW